MFYKTKQKSGMRTIIAPIKDAKTVTILALFGTGSKNEHSRVAGISHFLEHMFFKGTPKRPNTLAISEYLDEVGGEYNAFTSKEYTGYYAKVTPKYTDRAFDMISDILKNSKFDQEEIEKERGVIIEEMNMYQDVPMMYVGDLFEKLLYKNQPAGELIIGNKASIKNMKREDFIKYYQGHYHAGNLVVCVSGKITKEAAHQMINEYFSGFAQRKPVKKKKVVEKQARPEVLVNYKATDQSHIFLGCRGCDIFDKNKNALNLLSVILGGGMSSRLFISVREKLGLAYYIRSHAEYFTDSGYLAVHAGIDNKNIDKAIQVILREFNKIKSEGVSAKELKKAKEYIKGKTMMGLESSDEYGRWLALQEILTGKIIDIDKKLKLIDKVSPAEINWIANEVLVNNKLNLAIIGPYKSADRFQRYFSL